MSGLIHPQDDGFPPDPILEADLEETRDDVEQIRQLVRELNLAGGVASIYRRRPGSAQHTYEGEVPIDNFNLEWLRTVHGGGHYNVKLKSSSGKFAKTIKVEIDASHVGELDRKKEVQLPMTTGTDSNMMAFLLKNQEAAERRAEEAQRRAEAAQQQTMAAMIQSQQTMVQLMMGRPEKAAPEPMSRIIEVMAPLLVPMITQAFQPRSSGFGEVTELVKLAKELAPAGAATPAEPGEEDVMDKLGKILQVGAPIVQAFIERGRPQPMTQVNPTIRRPEPTPVTPAQPPPIPSPEDAQRQQAEKVLRELLGQLKLVTPILVKASRKNGAIESYLDFINDHLDDEQYQVLELFLQRDDWVTTLFGDNPEVTANLAWFENFRQMILHPDDDTPSEADSTGGAQAPGPAGVPE